jgi:hypothetical protein
MAIGLNEDNQNPGRTAALPDARCRHSCGSRHQFARPPHTGTELLLKPRRRGVPAARQGPDDDAISRVQLGQHCPRRMTKSSSHPMPIHCTADRLGNDQPDLWWVVCEGMSLAVGVHNKVRLRGSHTTAHGEVELG